MISKTGINLFTYLDYRKYLKDWYEYHKQNTTGFSFRSFSQKAGFGSPNFLKRVIEGERNLTESSTRAVIKCLELNKQESAFFERLVLFNQSTSHEEKNVHYHSIVTSQKFAQLK
ncbi:MAG TPA: TIGR02147 family protein, partial [bacterium]|nr:TIGR02147 family protein [bacterium]